MSGKKIKPAGSHVLNLDAGRARGRNGEFVPVRVDVEEYDNGHIFLGVSSRRASELYPLMLRLSTRDMLRVAAAIRQVAG